MKKIFVLAALTLLAGCTYSVDYPDKGSVCADFQSYDWVRVRGNPEIDYTVTGIDLNMTNAHLRNRDRELIVVSCKYLERINK